MHFSDFQRPGIIKPKIIVVDRGFETRIVKPKIIVVDRGFETRFSQTKDYCGRSWVIIFGLIIPGLEPTIYHNNLWFDYTGSRTHDLPQ
jgi:hypothetical protein